MKYLPWLIVAAVVGFVIIKFLKPAAAKMEQEPQQQQGGGGGSPGIFNVPPPLEVPIITPIQTIMPPTGITNTTPRIIPPGNRPTITNVTPRRR